MAIVLIMSAGEKVPAAEETHSFIYFPPAATRAYRTWLQGRNFTNCFMATRRSVPVRISMSESMASMQMSSAIYFD